MTYEDKGELFNTLATAIDGYAWVAANTLKEKFGTIDDEEEYKAIEQEVVDYAESEEFKQLVTDKEILLLEEIIKVSSAALEALTNGND